MKLILSHCIHSVLFVAALLFFAAPAAADEQAAPKLLSSDGKDQTGVAVTIYNVNLGLVKDQRTIPLPRGTGELRFMDVASQVIPRRRGAVEVADPFMVRDKEDACPAIHLQPHG